MREFDERMARERRQLMTRRAMVIGSAAAVIGLVAIPFLPRGKKLDPEDLLKPGLAQADPVLILKLCHAFHQHPETLIRDACATHLGALRQYPESRQLLWEIVDKDADDQVRGKALYSLIAQRVAQEYPRIVETYLREAKLRATA